MACFTFCVPLGKQASSNKLQIVRTHMEATESGFVRHQVFVNTVQKRLRYDKCSCYLCADKHNCIVQGLCFCSGPQLQGVWLESLRAQPPQSSDQKKKEADVEAKEGGHGKVA